MELARPVVGRPRSASIWTGSGAAWDAALLLLAQPAPIVQSWGWGEAEARLGHGVIRAQLPGGGLASVTLSGFGPLQAGAVNGGPVPATAETINELVAWARARGLARLSISPEAPPDELELEARGFQHRPADDTGHTRVLDLLPEAQMLESFRSTARNRVRRSIKEGVTVDIGREADVLARLTAMTAARQRIYIPGARVFQSLIDSLGWCRTFVARYQGEPVAAALAGRHAGRAYYFFGGSSGAHREVMAPHAVQWAVIRDAIAAGCKDYDMWGIPPDDDPAHPMHGIWLFKAGFGGRVERRAGVWEMVLSPWREALSRRERAMRAQVRDLRDRLRGPAK